MAEEKEVKAKTSSPKKAVIKKEKYKVEGLGKGIFFYKNKKGRLSWMRLPKGKLPKIGEEVEI